MHMHRTRNLHPVLGSAQSMCRKCPAPPKLSCASGPGGWERCAVSTACFTLPVPPAPRHGACARCRCAAGHATWHHPLRSAMHRGSDKADSRMHACLWAWPAEHPRCPSPPACLPACLLAVSPGVEQPTYYLMKIEPDEFGADHLISKPDGTFYWEGRCAHKMGARGAALESVGACSARHPLAECCTL